MICVQLYLVREDIKNNRMKAFEILDKQIKSIKFKNGTMIFCSKQGRVLSDNPNLNAYLNHIKNSIKKINYY